MKLLFALPMVAVAAAALAGCQSDEQVKQAFRDQYMTSCRQQFQQRAGQMGGMNADQFCTCSANRIIGNRSAADLRNYQPGPEAEEAGRQCAMEALGLSGNAAAPAAPPSLPTEAPAEPAGNESAGE